MEKTIRQLLLKFLGLSNYLQLISTIYICAIRMGFLRKKYPEIFYLKQLIKPGFICVDIGANVGYYSVQLSKLVNPGGHVYSVEPVPLFAKVFQRNCNKFAHKNVTLYQVALGAEQREVTLATPMMDGVFKHGLTHIVDGNNYMQGSATYKANMVIADELFAGLEKIDFLKCDVEGYETILFPQMINTIKRCMPIIQIEINNPENIITLYELLQLLGYKWHVLNNKRLEPIDKAEALKLASGDFYLMP
jgi:FkbM family methyltransferase